MAIDKALLSVTNTLANFSIDTAKLVELFYMEYDFIIKLRPLRDKVVIEIKSID